MRALEAAVVAAAGGALAWLTGLPLDLELWTASVGALNGAISGWNRVYPWTQPSGWVGFVLDSTWGLIGTAGSVLFHLIQKLAPSGRYLPELSERRGRHVYDGGYRIKPAFATAVGNVVTNAGGPGGINGPSGPRRRLLIDRHEMLHVWQNRLFGPLFPILYSSWAVVAGLVGAILGLRPGRTLRKAVITLAYYDNPFEYWAYRRDRYWPPRGADPDLVWPGRHRDERSEQIV